MDKNSHWKIILNFHFFYHLFFNQLSRNCIKTQLKATLKFTAKTKIHDWQNELLNVRYVWRWVIYFHFT